MSELAMSQSASSKSMSRSAGRPLATLCYQSRAARSHGGDDLGELIAGARERNRRFGVTGMLVHEGDRFFQWLEGPESALDTLWTSISRDGRHQDVELLAEGITPARLFSDWSLRFINRNEGSHQADDSQDGVAEEAASTHLARLALAGDEGAMASLVRSHQIGRNASVLCRTLFEPAAQQLGDWWCEDVCDSFEITLALGKLQSLVRGSNLDRPGLRRLAIEGRSILVSPPPREDHLLGATLLGGFFERAGWSVQAEFPHEDPALMGLVSSSWFDALALTLSDVFTRRDRLAALVQTIKDVRAASRNPKMAVLVGGRAFRASGAQDSALVGADVHYASASEAVGDLDHWLFMSRFRRDQGSPARQARTALDVVDMITPQLQARVRR